jgi:hypothetical protein
MRILKHEIQSISGVLKKHVGDASAELRLYGSRTDDQKRGGDIDLLLIVGSEALAKKLNSEKHWILSEIKAEIGDQKVDLKISTEAVIKTDAFLSLVFPASVVIWSQG